MPDVLVIGFGNPLRGDDGLGWRAAQELERADLGPDVHVVTCRQLTPERAADVAAAGFVLFIDAACDRPAGQVARLDVECGSGRPTFCVHQLDPSGLLALARDAYGAFPQAVALSVGAESFECGERMSAPVTAALADVLERARAIITRRLRAAACP